MGEMRDSDWSRQNLLRSDWLLLIGAIITTITVFGVFANVLNDYCHESYKDGGIFIAERIPFNIRHVKFDIELWV